MIENEKHTDLTDDKVRVLNHLGNSIDAKNVLQIPSEWLVTKSVRRIFPTPTATSQQTPGKNSTSPSGQASCDEKTIADLRKELQIMFKQMTDSNAEISQLLATNKELSSKLQSCQTEIKSATTEISNLTERLTISKTCASLLEEKASISANLQSLGTDLESLKTTTDTKIVQLEGEKRSLIDQSEKTKADLDRSQRIVKSLEQRVGQLHEEFDELKKESERNSIELKAALTNCQNDVINLEKSKDELTKEVETYMTESASLQKKVLLLETNRNLLIEKVIAQRKQLACPKNDQAEKPK